MTPEEAQQLMIEMLAALKTGYAGVIATTDKYRVAQQNLENVVRNLVSTEKTHRTALKDLKEARKAAIQQVIAEEKAHNKLNKAMEQAQRQIKAGAMGYREYGSAIAGAAKGAKTMMGQALKVGSAFGATAITLDKLVKVTSKYHMSMFQLSRSQQTVGRGMKDSAAALKHVKDNTVLSKNEFLDLANSAMATFVGIRPTNMEMAKMAEMMQNQFGPSAEIVKKSFEELLEVQKVFPAMYEDIQRAMKLVQEGRKEEAKQIRDNLILRAMGTDDLKRFIPLIAKSTTAVTEAQKKETEFNEKLAKTSQSVQDSQLAMGLSAEKAMLMAASATEKFYGWLEKIPGITWKISAAFAGLDIASTLKMAYQPVRLLAMGLTGLGTRGAKGLGKLPGLFTKATVKAKALSAAVGGIGGALSIAGAALAGAALGTAIDKAFGASDWVGEYWGKRTSRKFEKGLKEDMQGWKGTYGKAFDDMFSAMGGGGEGESSAKAHAIGVAAVRKIQKGLTADVVKAQIAQNQMTSAVKETTSSIADAAMESDKLRLNMEARLNIESQIKDALGSQISALEELGIVDGKIMLSRHKELQTMYAEMEKYGNSLRELFEAPLQEMGVVVDFDVINKAATAQEKMSLFAKSTATQYEKLRDIQAQATDPKEQEEAGKKAEALAGIRYKVLENSNKMLSQSRDIALDTRNISEKQWKTEEKFSGMYEQRLDTQRRLMEAAQFGLGASVEMMQKQVDLSYHMVQTSKQADENYKSMLQTQKGVSKEAIQAVQSAKSHADAVQIAGRFYKKETQQYRELITYASEHQNIMKTIMDHQLKIYELTKDIREGYLDSMREMSINAREFDKVIGTQELGVSQLMKTVHQATGEWKLNTMALGGFMEAGAASQASRQQVTGQYLMGGGGLQFQGGAAQEARNLDIYRYGDYANRFEQLQQGRGGAPTAGFGGIPEGQRYVDPQRAAELMGKSTEEGVYKGGYEGTYKGVVESLPLIIEVLNKSLNVGVRKGQAPGMERAGALDPEVLLNLLAKTLKGSKAPTPARGGGYTTTPEPLKVPGAGGGGVVLQLPTGQLDVESFFGKGSKSQQSELKELTKVYKATAKKYGGVNKGDKEWDRATQEVGRLAKKMMKLVESIDTYEEATLVSAAEMVANARYQKSERKYWADRSRGRIKVEETQPEQTSSRRQRKPKAITEEELMRRRAKIQQRKQEQVQSLQIKTKERLAEFDAQAVTFQEEQQKRLRRLQESYVAISDRLTAKHQGYAKEKEEMDAQELAEQKRGQTLLQLYKKSSDRAIKAANTQKESKIGGFVKSLAVFATMGVGREDIGAKSGVTPEDPEIAEMKKQAAEKKLQEHRSEAAKNMEARSRRRKEIAFIEKSLAGSEADPNSRISGLLSSISEANANVRGDGSGSTNMARSKIIAESKRREYEIRTGQKQTMRRMSAAEKAAMKEKEVLSLTKAEQQQATAAMKELYGFEGGQATATVIIKLDPSLQGRIESESNIAVELQSIS